MTTSFRLILALLGPFIAQTILACEQPEPISVPDGKTATEQQMRVAGSNYHNFMIGMQLYQKCLEDEAQLERRGADERSKEQVRTAENAYTSLHNSASAEMARATEALNKSIQDYQARQ